MPVSAMIGLIAGSMFWIKNPPFMDNMKIKTRSWPGFLYLVLNYRYSVLLQEVASAALPQEPPA
jgi:hypothetical protein